MPFESKSQQRFMYAKHPGIAKRWAHETKSIKKLPEKVKESMADCYGKLKKMEKKSHVMRAFFEEVGNLTKKAEGPPPLPKTPSMGGRKPLLPEVKYPKKETPQQTPAIKLPTSDKGIKARGEAYKNPGDIAAKRIQRGQAKAESRSQPKPATPRPAAKASTAKPGVAPKIKGKSGINMGHIGGAAALAAGMYAAHKASQPDQQPQYQ